jgi:hypothetical protein
MLYKKKIIKKKKSTIPIMCTYLRGINSSLNFIFQLYGVYVEGLSTIHMKFLKSLI